MNKFKDMFNKLTGKTSGVTDKRAYAGAPMRGFSYTIILEIDSSDYDILGVNSTIRHPGDLMHVYVDRLNNAKSDKEANKIIFLGIKKQELVVI